MPRTSKKRTTKKRTSKKKTAKKKTARKKTKKVSKKKKKSSKKSKKRKVAKKKKSKTKKRSRRKTKKRLLINMEEIYRLINKVQVSKKEVNFSVNRNETAVVDNLLSDVGIIYNKREYSKKTIFWLYPSLEEVYRNDEFDENFFSDEILENGQIF